MQACLEFISAKSRHLKKLAETSSDISRSYLIDGGVLLKSREQRKKLKKKWLREQVLSNCRNNRM